MVVHSLLLMKQTHLAPVAHLRFHQTIKRQKKVLKIGVLSSLLSNSPPPPLLLCANFLHCGWGLFMVAKFLCVLYRLGYKLDCCIVIWLWPCCIFERYNIYFYFYGVQEYGACLPFYHFQFCNIVQSLYF